MRSFIAFGKEPIIHLAGKVDSTDPTKGYLTPVWGVAIRETGLRPSARDAKELSRGWDGLQGVPNRVDGLT